MHAPRRARHLLAAVRACSCPNIMGRRIAMRFAPTRRTSTCPRSRTFISMSACSWRSCALLAHAAWPWTHSRLPPWHTRAQEATGRSRVSSPPRRPRLRRLGDDAGDLSSQLLSGFANRFHGLLDASLNVTSKADSTAIKEKLTLREKQRARGPLPPANRCRHPVACLLPAVAPALCAAAVS